MAAEIHNHPQLDPKWSTTRGHSGPTANGIVNKQTLFIGKVNICVCWLSSQGLGRLKTDRITAREITKNDKETEGRKHRWTGDCRALIVGQVSAAAVHSRRVPFLIVASHSTTNSLFRSLSMGSVCPPTGMKAQRTSHRVIYVCLWIAVTVK